MCCALKPWMSHSMQINVSPSVSQKQDRNKNTKWIVVFCRDTKLKAHGPNPDHQFILFAPQQCAKPIILEHFWGNFNARVIQCWHPKRMRCRSTWSIVPQGWIVKKAQLNTTIMNFPQLLTEATHLTWWTEPRNSFRQRLTSGRFRCTNVYEKGGRSSFTCWGFRSSFHTLAWGNTNEDRLLSVVSVTGRVICPPQLQMCHRHFWHLSWEWSFVWIWLLHETWNIFSFQGVCEHIFAL